MNKNLERARELVPSILLTLLSMIQALALEFFWGRLTESRFLWEGDAQALLGWMQVAAVLAGILLLWLFYVSIVLRFTWTPRVGDVLFPLFLGLLEFGMIETMRPDMVHRWLLLMSGVLALAIVTGYITLGRAAQDPANDYFFATARPRRLTNFRESFIATALVGGCGLGLLFLDSVALAFLGVGIALVSLAYQMQQTRVYWLHSMQDDNEEAA